ncbi:MAG: glutathione S-transferase family protein [Ramlibacter sp.]
MLTIHHLGTSQSERILWLCEELGVPYQMQKHERDAVTRLSPPALLALTPMGTAPVIEDNGLVLGESGAIVEYISAKYGGGRLVLKPDHPDYAQFLYWFHFANSSFQAVMGRSMTLSRTKLPADNPVVASIKGRLERALGSVETRLGEVPFLAGQEFTAADIMIVFSLTTMRVFFPLDLTPWPNIRAYLARLGERPAYQRAMAKGDPGFTPMLA